MIWYVNANAFRDGDGSEKRPFRWIDDAAKAACPGDEIIVAPGVYRERSHRAAPAQSKHRSSTALRCPEAP